MVWITILCNSNHMRDNSTDRLLDEKKPNHKKIVVICLLLVALFSLTYDILIGGNIAYGRKWMECGSKPVIMRSGKQLIGFGGQAPSWNLYTNPGFFDEKVGHLTVVDSTLYCSVQQAREAHTYIEGPYK